MKMMPLEPLVRFLKLDELLPEIAGKDEKEDV